MNDHANPACDWPADGGAACGKEATYDAPTTLGTWMYVCAEHELHAYITVGTPVNVWGDDDDWMSLEDAANIIMTAQSEIDRKVRQAGHQPATAAAHTMTVQLQNNLYNDARYDRAVKMICQELDCDAELLQSGKITPWDLAMIV